MATKKYRPKARSRRIALTNGDFATVDARDFLLIAGKNWRKQLDKAGNVLSVVSGSASRTVLLHRLIMAAARHRLVDHKNGDPLDNRRENLRECTHAQNMRNRKIHRNNRSGFKGVTRDAWAAKLGRPRIWRATITVAGRKFRLGRFLTPQSASRAYRVASAKFHGEFGRVT